MLDALYTAATGMLSQQTGLDVIANNLANVNTVGYKESRAAFADLLYTQTGPGRGAGLDTQLGHGVQISATQTSFEGGAAQTTGQPTDMRVDGDGFFVVQRPDGSNAYTRAGNFGIDARGRLVTADGAIVQPGVTFPAGAKLDTMAVGADGTVTADVGSQSKVVLGKLQVATFANPQGLEQIGGSLFAETANSGTAQIGAPNSAGRGGIVQGQLEMANVNAVDEMVNMITTQRAYDAVAKVVTASDEMLSTANQLRR